MKNNVCVVTVTYGDRKNYLSQVVDACLSEEKIKKIILVDKASTCDKNFMDSFKTDKIEWIRLDENTGSANGYHVGIKKAHENSQCEFIWLLDDDNVPQEDCLTQLLAEYGKFEKSNKYIAVQARRPKFSSHQRLFSMENPANFFKSKNSFLDFNLSKLYEKVKFVLSGRKANEIKNYSSIIAPYTQYGGLLFKRELIDVIRYPKKELFLYADDSEFTYRITQNSGTIYIIKDAIVDDVDLSWNYKSENKVTFPILEQGSDFRVYYSVRNQSHFEINNFKFNKISYLINKNTYILLLCIYAFKVKRLNRCKLILLALKDAENNKLGERENLNND